MNMTVVSLNVALPRVVEYRGREVETGIFKAPTTGPVMMRTLNLDGDGQADLSVHGGPDKAVYVYSRDYYEYWEERLGRDDLSFGQFGENLTVEGMTDETVRIGDVFTVGDATVQVTQPRLPCYKLAIRMEDPTFPKLFLASRRTGFYLRVLNEGAVDVGDEFELVERESEPLTVLDVVEISFFDRDNLERAKSALSVKALPQGWRVEFTERLVNAGQLDEGRLDDRCGPS